MKKIFLVTGACGHLGSTILRQLSARGEEARGLILPKEQACDTDDIHYYKGDVTKLESLRPFFAGLSDREVYVIHTAGIVDISEEITPLLYEVNVNGTRRIIEMCLEYQVKRLLYVSSVHAIPEKEAMLVQNEVLAFSPDSVTGGYAKTKAEATRLVLNAAAAGMDAVIVQPSGILGPYDKSGNHLVQLVTDYIFGRLPACVKGGYDFVDVRDVADGCIRAALQGKTGECYILSNRRYEIKDVLKMVRKVNGGRRLAVLPIWIAKACVPFIRLDARRKKRRPLYTRYSLYTLSGNSRFSHDKATAELGYRPRDLFETVRDTVRWTLDHMPSDFSRLKAHISKKIKRT